MHNIKYATLSFTHSLIDLISYAMLCKIFFANGGGSSALLFVLTRGCNFATKRRSKVSGLVCLLSLRGLVACLLKRE